MKYHLVIFDFDGTLADSYPWFLSVFSDLARRYHLPDMTIEDIEKLRSMDIKRILREYRIPVWKMLLVGNHLKKLMSSQIDQIKLVDGMQEVIEALSVAGVRLAVVTSNAGSNVRRVLGPQYTPFFEIIEDQVSMFGKKQRFQKILRKTGISADRTLCIGDEIRDLHSARSAKIPFGAVTWGYTDLKMLQEHAPTEIFSHPAQISEAVTQIQA